MPRRVSGQIILDSDALSVAPSGCTPEREFRMNLLCERRSERSIEKETNSVSECDERLNLRRCAGRAYAAIENVRPSANLRRGGLRNAAFHIQPKATLCHPRGLKRGARFGRKAAISSGLFR